MVVLIARYYVRAGQGDAVEAALREMAPLVKAQEPGCLLYQANRSREDRDRFLLVEHYRDEAALEAHRATPHFQRLIEGTILPLLERRERELYDLVVA